MADPAGGRCETKLGIALAVLVVVVTLLNGSVVFMQRTGLLDNAEYHRSMESIHSGPQFPNWNMTHPRMLRERIYQAPLEGNAPYLKLLKDGVILLMALLSVCFLVSKVDSLPLFRNAWPAYLLAGVTLISLLLTAWRYGVMLPLIGLRAFSYLYLALIGGWLAKEKIAAGVTAAAGALLVIETVLAVFEGVRGLPMYGYRQVIGLMPARMLGTFDLPNSFGIFAALAFAFYRSHSRKKEFVTSLFLVTLLLVFVSGSATGAIVLALVMIQFMAERLSRWRGLFISLTLILVAVLYMNLPLVTGRWDVFWSLTGRSEELGSVISGLKGSELVIGRAFGAGTNGAFQLFRPGSSFVSADQDSIVTASAESMPALLLLGTGLPGLVLFYLLLLWAMIKHSEGRLFFSAVLLASLTCKVGELFPVNIFIAVALARTFAAVAIPGQGYVQAFRLKHNP